MDFFNQQLTIPAAGFIYDLQSDVKGFINWAASVDADLTFSYNSDSHGNGSATFSHGGTDTLKDVWIRRFTVTIKNQITSNSPQLAIIISDGEETPTISSIGNPTVASVSISGSVSLSAGSSVAITGTATVSVTGTPTVSFSSGSTVGISGTATVSISGTPTVSIGSQSAGLALDASLTTLHNDLVAIKSLLGAGLPLALTPGGGVKVHDVGS